MDYNDIRIETDTISLKFFTLRRNGQYTNTLPTTESIAAIGITSVTGTIDVYPDVFE